MWPLMPLLRRYYWCRRVSSQGVASHHTGGKVYWLEPGRLGVDSEKPGFSTPPLPKPRGGGDWSLQDRLCCCYAGTTGAGEYPHRALHRTTPGAGMMTSA